MLKFCPFNSFRKPIRLAWLFFFLLGSLVSGCDIIPSNVWIGGTQLRRSVYQTIAPKNKPTSSTHRLTEGYLLATSRHVPAGQNDVTPRGQAAKQHLACKTGATFFAPFSGDHEANVERETRTTRAGIAVAWDKQHATKRLTMVYFHNFWRGVSLVIKE